MTKKILVLPIFLILTLTSLAQLNKHDLSFTGTGDLTMPLGRYEIGTAIHILCQAQGGWAEQGGIYHIAGTWSSLPKVIYRGESCTDVRLKFYGYVDQTNVGYMFLFATWVNQSPSKSYSNIVSFSISSMGSIDPNNQGSFSNATMLESELTVNSNTNSVGIGIDNPGTYKLAVEGTIGARKVKVTQAPWADYVFDPSYNLPSLKEVEQYIKQHKHLPDVPTAKEVESNGIDLGDNQATLLKKIEELTLYIIDQNKKLNEQNTQLTIQIKKNEDQNKRLEEQAQLLKKQSQMLEQYHNETNDLKKQIEQNK
jgi:hypothetical protein